MTIGLDMKDSNGPSGCDGRTVTETLRRLRDVRSHSFRAATGPASGYKPLAVEFYATVNSRKHGGGPVHRCVGHGRVSLQTQPNRNMESGSSLVVAVTIGN